MRKSFRYVIKRNYTVYKAVTNDDDIFNMMAYFYSRRQDDYVNMKHILVNMRLILMLTLNLIEYVDIQHNKAVC